MVTLKTRKRSETRRMQFTDTRLKALEVPEAARKLYDAEDKNLGLKLLPSGRKQFFWRNQRIFLLAIAGCLCPMSVFAQTHVNAIWVGGADKWSNPWNWSPYGVPNNTAETVYDVIIDATITNSSEAAVSLDMDVTVASLVLGGPRATSQLYSLSCNGLGGGETLDITGTFTVNREGHLLFCGPSRMTVAGNTTVSNGTLSYVRINNGPATETFGALTNTGQILLSASQLTATSIINSGSVKIQSFSTLSTGDYAQTKGLTWTGSGVGTNLGPTTISAEMTVSGGSIISGGDALFNGDVNLEGGTIAVPLYRPNVPGSGLPISGNYTQGDAAKMVVELGKVDCSRLIVSGNASISGTLTVKLIGGLIPQVGEVFTIMTYHSETGTFTTLNLPTLSGGDTWSISYNNANAIVLTVNP